LIDPYLVTVPSQNAKSEVVENYLSKLGQWTKLITEHEHNFWFSEPAIYALFEAGEYLYPNKLNDLLIRSEVVTCDSTTVGRAFEILLSPPYLDDQITQNNSEIKDLFRDEKQTVVIPKKIADRLNQKVADGLRLTLSKLAYCCQYGTYSLAKEIVFATGDLNGDDDGGYYRMEKDKLIPVEVAGKWPAITSPEKMRQLAKLCDFWRDTPRAVEWAYYDLIERRELDPDRHKLPAQKYWSVGKHFNESIDERGIQYYVELSEIFHADEKKHQVIRKRDGAFAWRAHVTNKPSQLRLHYWIIDDDKLEMANVVYKPDLHIEEE
jgi:hypothetical protein